MNRIMEHADRLIELHIPNPLRGTETKYRTYCNYDPPFALHTPNPLRGTETAAAR
jgi:hypothetical protein